MGTFDSLNLARSSSLMAQRERWVHDRMFRLLLSCPCCAPKAQHPILFCSPADLLTGKVRSEMGWVECGGEVADTGKAEVGQTLVSISPDCIFSIFNYPLLTATQKY